MAESMRKSKEVLREFNDLKNREKGEELLRLLPQGHNSGLNACMVDDLHAKDIIDVILDTLRKRHLIGGAGGGDLRIHGNEYHDPDFLTEATDEKVKVSADDTTADFLLAKLLAGTGITLTESSPGGNEKVEISTHRKWEWADAQGQKKCFRLPLVGSSAVGQGWNRYAGNPVIPYGLEGTHDVTHTMHPSACYSLTEEKFFIAYCGYAGSGAGYKKICIAKSSDGKTGFSAVMVLQPSDFRADGYWLQTPSLMYDDVAGKWKLWCAFQYRINSTKYNRIAYAENSSDDPTTGSWTNLQYFTAPSSDELAGFGAVLRMGSMYYMLHFDVINNLGALRVSHSYDGLNWTYLGEALPVASAGKWDDGAVAYCSVMWNLGVWYLLYSGWGSGENWTYAELGMATSVDSIGKDYSRLYVEDGKILTKGTAGQWDQTSVYGPAMLMLDDVFYMYYGGWNGSKLQIGLATLPT